MPGWIGHLNRSEAPDRSRRKDNDGQEICTGCGILAYNADRSQSGSAEHVNRSWLERHSMARTGGAAAAPTRDRLFPSGAISRDSFQS
jgi:hypothetical protein